MNTNTEILLDLLTEVENTENIERKVEHEIKTLKSLYEGTNYSRQKLNSQYLADVLKTMSFYITVGIPTDDEIYALMNMSQEDRIRQYIAKTYVVIDAETIEDWKESLVALYETLDEEEAKLNHLRVILDFVLLGVDYK